MTYLAHPITGQLLEAFIGNPQGSLYISGPPRSGVTSSLEFIIRQIFDNPNNFNLERFVPQQWTDPKQIKQAYRIERVRQLVRRLNLVASDQQKPRLVVIDDCQLLNIESQNTLLKALEEPDPKTHFLLGCHSDNRVLPTIISRCQPIKLKRPPKEAVWKNWSTVPADQIERAYLIADGWPAIMVDLLVDPEKSTISQQVKLAKTFLQLTSPAAKIVFLEQKRHDNLISDLLAGLQRVCRAALINVALKNRPDECQKWYRLLRAYQDLNNQILAGNNNPKIIGLALSIV